MMRPAGTTSANSRLRRLPVSALLLVAILAVFVAVHAQSGSQSGQSTVTGAPPNLRETPLRDSYDPVFTERRVNALNVERQKLLVSDTNKLLHLAQELHDEVGLSNNGEWTPDKLRKLAEIEKLARSVRQRMTTAVGAPSPLGSPDLIDGAMMH